MSEKKYYWLKLDRRFFKRHDIRIVEAMPNGKDYILFYLKLLCESVSHDGELRFSEAIPYNEQMLAIVTDTNVDVVKAALDVFSGLKMIEVLDDGTLYMTESQKMLGSETEWAKKKREYRLRQSEDNVLALSDKSKSQSKSKSKSQSKSQNIGAKAPRVDVFREYAGDDDEMLSLLREYNEMRNRKKKPMTDRAKKMLVNKLDTIPAGQRIQSLEEAIYHAWDSVYLPKEPVKTGNEITPVVLQEGETDRLKRLTEMMRQDGL